MSEDKTIKLFLISEDSSTKEAMRLIDHNGSGIVFVVDENEKFLGTVSDGDIRRAILGGANIEKPVKGITNSKAIYLNEKTADEELSNLTTNEKVKEKIPDNGSLIIPIIDEQKKVKDIASFSGNGKSSFLFKNRLEINKERIKRILLIGGAGYLGSVLCRKLLASGYKVKVLDNLSYGEDGLRGLYQDQNFELLRGDIRNISDIMKGIRDIDAVIHLAAIVGDPACSAKPQETLEINYLATKNIIETCKYFQINRLVFASTCSVYGKSSFPDEKLGEESSLNPISLYAETKIRCEKAILDAIDENFSPTILRMATLYGYSPNMRFDLAVNIMAAKAFFDREITVFGGEQWRPWLHLEDASSAYISCLEKPLDLVRGQIFNVLSENHKITDVGKIINSVCPQAQLKLSEEAVDLRNYNVSFDKICQSLNFMPKKKITDGVAEIGEAINAGIIKGYKDAKYRVLTS